jgi:ethanolamine ammonia-lyase small subunit
VDTGSREENASKYEAKVMMAEPPARSLRDLRDLTPARVGLGRSGASLPTEALLAFTLDHARARDAVHAAFDVSALREGLGAQGLATFEVQSRAGNRRDYLRRPDLGRMLDQAAQGQLIDAAREPCRLVLVVGDGLSPAAVDAHAVELVRHLRPLLASDGIEAGCAVIASGARVALGDEIGALLGAQMVVMLIGERPGLSSPDSLGAYLTYGPKPGLTDADRNCVSNIHRAGLGYQEAAAKIGWLVREGLARQVTGVALKDESGGAAPSRIASPSR